MVYIINYTIICILSDNIILYKIYMNYIQPGINNQFNILYLYILNNITYIYILKEYRVVNQKFIFYIEKGILISFKGNYIYRVFILSYTLNKIVWLLSMQFNKLNLIINSDNNDDNINKS